MLINLNKRLTDVSLIMTLPLLEFFIKGLKNAHTLATKVYEKGPQSLADTMKEVEKFQAAQQLTSTLLPPSLVNTMSNAKKLATWQTIALTSDALTVIIMGMSQQIGPTKSHLQAHQQDAGTTTLVGMIDQHLGVIITPGITTMTIGIGTGSVDLNLTPTGVTVIVTFTEIALDPFTDPHATAHHATEV